MDKVLLHPDGGVAYTRMEEGSPPGWRGVLHPGGEKVFLFVLQDYSYCDEQQPGS